MLSMDFSKEMTDSGVGAAAISRNDPLNTGDLSSLNIIPFSNQNRSTNLKGLRVIVVGGGPAGLTFARAATAQGAQVTLLEQAGDPRTEDPGYTDRSFNVTLDNVGRYVLGDSSIWKTGTDVVGRAVHNYKGTGKPYHAKYGSVPEASLVSIARPVLRQNMVNVAIAEGAKILFHAKVTDVDPDNAIVWYTDPSLKAHKICADLVVMGDGLHTMSDKLPVKDRLADYYLKPESRSCISGIIYPENNHNLSLNHIHFWHALAAEACAIGVPNADGTIAVLLISSYDDIGQEEHPFATPDLAKARMLRDFPDVLNYNPQMIHFLPERRRYRFHYKAASSYRVGARAILVGDAGCVVPPWAGFGANSAMFSAASLVYHLVKRQDSLECALQHYNAQQTVLARNTLDYVKKLGDFLNGPVTQEPDKLGDPELAKLILVAQNEAEKSLVMHQAVAV
jgi:2-polyprenyl-6-methoxyphenol hydroxylase-like FAD-dependent oxidoreductase